MQNQKTLYFLQKLKDSGYWNNDYDYSQVNFIKTKDKVLIVDTKYNTKHLIKPESLLRGVICCSRNLKNGFLSFDDAKIFVYKLKLKSETVWSEYITTDKKPHNIPSSPSTVYTEWISWGDWLGTESVASRYVSFLSFDEARDFVRKLKMKSQNDWAKYRISGDRPKNIPSNPSKIYKKEWISWSDFLGYETKYNNTGFIPFNDAREFVRKLNIKNRTDWKNYCNSGNKPKNIPFNPYGVYIDEWISAYDFFGTKIGFDGQYCSYEECKEFVRKLGLKNQYEWFDYCKSGNKPHYIPADPVKVYGKRK